MKQKAILHFKKVDPVLYTLASQFDIEIQSRGDNYFRNLTRSIIGQQLSVKAASTIFSRFETLFDNNNINPEELLTLPSESLRAVGISQQKAQYLKGFAEMVVSNTISLEILSSLEDENVIEELIKIKGIGRWTAEMFLMFTLNRPDVFSFGDLGLLRAIEKLYGIQSPSLEELEKITNVWSPYRTYACLVLWRSLDNEPNKSQNNA